MSGWLSHGADQASTTESTPWGQRVVETAPTTPWGRPLAEATAPSEAELADTAARRRLNLTDAVMKAHNVEDGWAWVRDFNDETVWFDVAAADETSLTWAQDYTKADDGIVTLTGERSQVQAITTYIPANRPVGKLTPRETDDAQEGRTPYRRPDRLVAEANGRQR